ncbi:MAG: hypothetical protein ABJN98_01205 [Roseibium sp.]
MLRPNSGSPGRNLIGSNNISGGNTVLNSISRSNTGRRYLASNDLFSSDTFGSGIKGNCSYNEDISAAVTSREVMSGNSTSAKNF